MSSELIPLADAAKMLGVSEEKLKEMRSSGEISGLRDGTSWKFKSAELQRVADDMGVNLNPVGAGDDLLESDDEFSLSDSHGKDIISEVDTPVESESSQSGLLSDSEDLLLADSNSGVALDSGDALLEDSGDLDLANSGELNFGESDLSLASKLDEESVIEEPSATGASASDTGKSVGDDLELMDEDLFEDDELSLQDSLSLDDGSDLSSDFVDSSDVIVDDSDSNAPEADDLILDEEDLVVSQGSDDDDDFALSDSDMLNLDDGADDFDLEPIGESLDDQSSSSQVIALEDSELMDDSNATMMMDNASGDLLSDEYPGGSDAMPLESFDAPGGEMEYDDGMVSVPAEPPYSMAQIAALSATMLFMALLVVLTLNLAQNMWQPADSGFTSTVANWIANDLLGFEG